MVAGEGVHVKSSSCRTQIRLSCGGVDGLAGGLTIFVSNQGLGQIKTNTVFDHNKAKGSIEKHKIIMKI